jgi:hypothetical protein
MSMGPTKMYLRYCKATNKLYLTGYEDEDRYKDEKEQWKILESRQYGTYEELMAHNGPVKNSSMVIQIIDERYKIEVAWERFKKDRVVGWQKEGKVLTQEMLELLGADGVGVNLDKLTNKQKDLYYRLIACKIMRLQSDREKVK